MTVPRHAAAAGMVAVVAGAVALGAIPQQTGTVDLARDPHLVLRGAAPDDRTGIAIAPAGDIDGDGVGDVIVGSPESSPSGRARAGVVTVAFTRPGNTGVDLGEPGAPVWRIIGPAANGSVGYAVAGVGDVNGDGRPDIAIGAPFADHNGANSGSVYVVFGGSTAPVDLAALGNRGFRIDGQGGGDNLGIAVTSAGDVNGDGRRDLLIGAPNVAAGLFLGAGAAYVVFGTGDPGTINTGALAGRGFTVRWPVAGARLGSSVDAADVNGDGTTDLVIGAPGPTGPGSPAHQAGAVVVFGGATTDVDVATPPSARVALLTQATSTLPVGTAVAAGDMTGDGRAEVMLTSAAGTPAASTVDIVNGTAVRGQVNLADLTGIGRRVAIGASLPIDAPHMLAAVGDVNGDGFGDLAVGVEPATEAGRAGSGSVSVVYGGADVSPLNLADPLGARGLRILGPAAGLGIGHAVSSAGDVDADGRPDVAVGGLQLVPGATPPAVHVVSGFGPPSVTYPAVTGSVGVALTPVTPRVARTGAATFTVTPALPPGLALDTATGTLSGTPLNAVDATFTVTMADAAGSVDAPVRVTIGVPPPGGVSGGPGGGGGAGGVIDTAHPTMRGVTLSARRFRPGARVRARRRGVPAVGARLSMSINEDATLRIVVQRLVKGRARAAGALPVRVVRAGRVVVVVTGRIGARRLAPGAYRLAVTATDVSGNVSHAVLIPFTVVP